MTIIPKGNGPFSRALRELDQRTVSLIQRPVPGARVSRYTRGVVSEPTVENVNRRQTASQRPRWG